MPSKEEYLKRRAAGLCSNCSELAIPNRTMCSKCAAIHAQKYRSRQLDGKCFNCDQPALAGKTRCESCANHQRQLALLKRKNRRENLQCVECGKAATKSYCDSCLKKQKDQRDAWKLQGLCQSCGKPACGRSRCPYCIAINKESVFRLKIQIFDAYGGAKCACCGEEHLEFLSLDHVNNDGAVHRRLVTSSGVYRSLRKSGYPPGYQVLCHNCNWAKYAYGECPHQKEKKKK